jgi:hypothetical protein
MSSFNLQEPTNIAFPSKSIFEVANAQVETTPLSHAQASWLWWCFQLWQIVNLVYLCSSLAIKIFTHLDKK